MNVKEREENQMRRKWTDKQIRIVWTKKRIDKEFKHFSSLPYSLQFQIVERFLQSNKKDWQYFHALMQIWMESEEP